MVYLPRLLRWMQEPLSDALQDTHPMIRAQACEALGASGPEASNSEDRLSKANPNPNWRRAALKKVC